MKKLLCGLLLSSIALGTAHGINSNRTYIAGRDTLSNNFALDGTAAIRRCICKTCDGKNCTSADCPGRGSKKRKFGADFLITGFYRHSHNAKDLAKFFGAGQAADANQDGTIIVENTTSSSPQGLLGWHLDHTPGGTDKAMKGTVKLDPSREEYGAHFRYYQSLDHAHEGLFFEVVTPYIEVNNNIGFSVASSVAHSETSIGHNGKTLANYFDGETFTKTAVGSQQALKYLKMNSKKRTASGFADVRASLGYHLYREADSSFTACIHTIIPTGNDPKAVWLFEPVYGNGGHVGLGAGANATFKLWKHKTKPFRLNVRLRANYTYLFEGSEKRVLGVWDHTKGLLVSAGHYRNLGEKATTSAIPAVNALAQNVKVIPGSQFDGVVSFSLAGETLFCDIGYNIFAREEESIELKTKWVNSKYGFLEREHDVSTAPIIGKDTNTVGGPIQAEGDKSTAVASDGTALGTPNYTETLSYYVSTKACKTPSAITHKGFGSLGFTFKKLRFPITISLGGECEFDPNTTNRVVASWAAWGKLQVGF